VAETATDLTDKKKSAIVESLANGTTRTAACEAAEISRWTYYDWLKKDKEFAARVDAALASQISVAEDSLFKQVLKGNTTAIIFSPPTYSASSHGPSRGRYSGPPASIPASPSVRATARESLSCWRS